MAGQKLCTFYFFDFLTGDFLGGLPLASPQWSSTLNGVGSLSGTIPLTDPNVAKLNPVGLTAPGRTACFIDYGGQLAWGGISLPPRPFTLSTRVLSYTAQELYGYFSRRVQATDYSSPPYSGITGTGTTMSIWNAANNMSGGEPYEWDPLLMAAQVIYDALDVPYGSPIGGMQMLLNGTALSGTPPVPTAYLASPHPTPNADFISMNFPYASPQYVATIVSQLTGLGYGVGCDIGVDVAYSGRVGSPPVATINLDYPRRGDTFANNHVVVNVATARDYTVTPDASTMAWRLYELGGSSDIVVSENLNPPGQGYALFESIVSRSQIQSADISSILARLGYGDLFLSSYPPVTFSVICDLFGTDPAYGSFKVGDNCRLMIPPDEMFPDGLDSEWRITAYQASLPDQGDATLTLTIAPPPVYPIGPFIAGGGS